MPVFALRADRGFGTPDADGSASSGATRDRTAAIALAAQTEIASNPVNFHRNAHEASIPHPAMMEFSPELAWMNGTYGKRPEPERCRPNIDVIW